NTTYYAGFNDPTCPDLLPVIIESKVEPPTGSASGEYMFCTSNTWLTVVGKIEPEDTLLDIDVCGMNLKWYDQAMVQITNPGNTVLTDGAVFYVTQTIGGCESEPLEVMVSETDCGCFKSGYEFH